MAEQEHKLIKVKSIGENGKPVIVTIYVDQPKDPITQGGVVKVEPVSQAKSSS